MIEIVILVLSLGGIANRARQRGSSGTGYLMTAGLGWLFFFASSAAVGVGPAFALRWFWVAGVYAVLEASGGGNTVESWMCPECRMYNEPGTLYCPCGYQHPE